MAAAPSASTHARVPQAAPAAQARPTKFDHAAHAARKVDVAHCTTCHGDDRKGTLALPGRAGHQPCLASGCHVDDFLSIGPDTQKSDPARYKKAAEFCRGCHASATGDAPRRFDRPPADAVYKGNSSPGYHVEMNHLAHSQRAPCRSCHVVDARTFALLPDRPGHAECAACHAEAGHQGPAMTDCDGCHHAPGPAAYFAKPRPHSDVRSCGSDSHAQLEKQQGRALPCFKHERREHRFQGQKPVQCGACHYMMADRSKWGGHAYKTLRDIKSSPIIDNDRDREHRSCGASSACHRRDVSATGNCRLCHSNKVTNSIFDDAPSRPRRPGKKKPSENIFE